jgi:formate-dependent nitrite reductase membrane component NrfD
MYLAAEHFVRAPGWTFYILGYFFFAGLSGGSYAIATLLRVVGDARDEPAARIGFYTSLVTLLACPLLLTVDLGEPLRFWHMMVNVSPGDAGLNFKYWSPMSVGVWALLVFGFFATVSALESFVLDRRDRTSTTGEISRPYGGVLGRAFNIIGALFALFIASYTGVLLSVSNQPIWSDTWTLGGLFLASGLSGSAALIGILISYRRVAMFTLHRLDEAGWYFSILEVVLLAAFLITVIAAGTAARLLPWTPLFLLAVIGIGTSLVTLRGRVDVGVAEQGSTTVERKRVNTAIVCAVILAGVLAMRAAVIFSAQ